MGCWSSAESYWLGSVNSGLAKFGVEGNVDLKDDLEEGRPIFFPPVLELSENCRSELASTVSHKNNYRVEHYMLALEIIQRNT